MNNMLWVGELVVPKELSEQGNPFVCNIYAEPEPVLWLNDYVDKCGLQMISIQDKQRIYGIGSGHFNVIKETFKRAL